MPEGSKRAMKSMSKDGYMRNGYKSDTKSGYKSMYKADTKEGAPCGKWKRV